MADQKSNSPKASENTDLIYYFIPGLQLESRLLAQLSLIHLLFDLTDDLVKDLELSSCKYSNWPLFIRLISSGADVKTLAMQFFDSSANAGVHGLFREIRKNLVTEFEQAAIQSNDTSKSLADISRKFIERFEALFLARFSELPEDANCEKSICDQEICKHCRVCLQFIEHPAQVGYRLALEFFKLDEVLSPSRHRRLPKPVFGTTHGYPELPLMSTHLPIITSSMEKVIKRPSPLIISFDHYNYGIYRLLPFLFYHEFVSHTFVGIESVNKSLRPIMRLRRKQDASCPEFADVFLVWLAKEFLRFRLWSGVPNIEARETNAESLLDSLGFHISYDRFRDLFQHYNQHIELLLNTLEEVRPLAGRARQASSNFLSFVRNEFLPFQISSSGEAINEEELDHRAWQLIRQFCCDMVLLDRKQGEDRKWLLMFEHHYVSNTEMEVERTIRASLSGGLEEYFNGKRYRRVQISLNLGEKFRQQLIGAFALAIEDNVLNAHLFLAQLEEEERQYKERLLDEAFLTSFK